MTKLEELGLPESRGADENGPVVVVHRRRRREGDGERQQQRDPIQDRHDCFSLSREIQFGNFRGGADRVERSKQLGTSKSFENEVWEFSKYTPSMTFVYSFSFSSQNPNNFSKLK